MSKRGVMTRRGALKTSAMASVAVVSGCGGGGDLPPPAVSVFQHGVAAGMPTATSLLLWTRLTDMIGDVPVRVVVARDAEMRQELTRLEAVALEENDYTVRVRVDGLPSGTDCFYRFELVNLENDRSRVGRARTLQVGSPAQVRLATATCASYAHGYFHAYRRIAEEPLDAVIHLGDYIYEYGDGEYGDFRPYDPPTELRSLSDYRRRYAYYRRDADLQFLHSCHAMLCTWDDHESVNNATPTGSMFHDPQTDGPYPERLAAATRAYDEWLPIDRPLWQVVSFGDLLDLIILETRVHGRDPSMQTMLGLDQREWLLTTLRNSTAKWKLIAGSVQFAPHTEFWNFDAWDAFPEERQLILETIRDAGITNTVFVCGDGHKSFVDQLVLDDMPVSSELMTPAISSPNAFGAAARQLEEAIYMGSPTTQFVDTEQRGYVLFDVRPERVLLEHRFIESVVDSRGGAQRVASRFELRDGDPRLYRLETS